jgi:hypothetical protein
MSLANMEVAMPGHPAFGAHTNSKQEVKNRNQCQPAFGLMTNDCSVNDKTRTKNFTAIFNSEDYHTNATLYLHLEKNKTLLPDECSHLARLS